MQQSINDLVAPQHSVQTPAFNATPTPDPTAGESYQMAALTGAVSVGNPVNGQKGMRLRMYWLQDGTGGRLVTYTGGNWVTANLTPQGTAASSLTIDEAECVDGTLWKVTRLLTPLCRVVTPFTGIVAAAQTLATITVPNDGNLHYYKIAGFITITTLGSGSINFQISYNASDGSARTRNLPIAQPAANYVQVANGANDWAGSIEICVAAGSTITIATAGTFTGCTYNAGVTVEQVN